MQFNCPLCNTVLVKMFGDIMHPGDREHGVTLSCPGAYPSVCPAQEVMGHGDNEMGAFSVIQQKYHKVNE